MDISDLNRFDKKHLASFLGEAISKISDVKDLKPLSELISLPDPMRMNFNINYTNSDHDEILYMTKDLHFVVMKLDTEKNVGRVVFYKQLDFLLDLMSVETSSTYYGSFLLSIEPITDGGVQGYFDQGKGFQIVYVSMSSRRAFAHVLELSKDPQTNEFQVRV